MPFVSPCLLLLTTKRLLLCLFPTSHCAAWTLRACCQSGPHSCANIRVAGHCKRERDCRKLHRVGGRSPQGHDADDRCTSFLQVDQVLLHRLVLWTPPLRYFYNNYSRRLRLHDETPKLWLRLHDEKRTRVDDKACCL